jgi:hypothetical protein
MAHFDKNDHLNRTVRHEMTNVKFDQPTENTRDIIMARLNKLDLVPDKRMMQILLDNPQYKNRLISLFNTLKKCNIKLNDALHDTIASNISNTSGAASILQFINGQKIDFALIPLELVFQGAESEVTLSSMQSLSDTGSLDLATLKLILSYPELADLLINFHSHCYSTEKIVEKLPCFSAQNMYAVKELLTILLDKNLFYLDCLDIFLKQQQYIENIYKGTKKLAAADKLDECYFEVIEQDASNANLLASLILLLQDPPLLDYRKKSDLLLASKLGLGAFHFLSHLRQTGLLNEASYQKVCQNNWILAHPDVIDSFCSLLLFTRFDREELEYMLTLITKEPSSNAHLTDFIEVIQAHQVTNYPGPGCQ